MVVVFELDGVEYRCEARELSTCGAFLTCTLQEPPGHLELRIDAGGQTLHIPGDVVRSDPEGLGVVFGALGPATRNHLDRLLQSGEAPGTGEVFDEEENPAPQDGPTGRVQVAGEDWTPPVSEPILHQWKPETELVPPPPGDPEPATWEDLPTISPPAIFTASPAARTNTEQPAPPEASRQPAPADAQPVTAPATAPSSGEQPDALAQAYLAGESTGGQQAEFDTDTAAQELDTLIDESFAEAASTVPTDEQPGPSAQSPPRPPASVQTIPAGTAAAPPEPAVTEPAVPEPAVPEPAVPEPAAAEPAVLEDPADRRLNERVEQSIPVTFDTMTSLIKEFTHNISFGGLFVYTTSPLQKGEETAVTLVHPVHGERLSLLATVVHASSAPSPDPVSGAQRYGVGVEFRLPPAELKRMLSDFITSHTRQAETSQTASIVGEARTILARGARSYHELLGVDSNAPLDKIRRAYFKLVDRFHPDRYFDKVGKTDQRTLEELFRNLTKAYEELTT